MHAKHRLRAFGIISAVAASAALLGGCAGSNGGDEQGTAEISFLANNTPNLTEKFWNDAIGRFEKANPKIKVTLVQAPNSDTTGYAKKLAGSGQLPDVQTGLQVSQFVQAGQLLAFDKSDLKGFKDPMAGAIDGKQYQLPVASIIAPVMYYNKALFEKAHVSVPTTWDEFLAACATLKSAGITPLEVGGNDAPTLTATLMDYLVSVNVLSSDPDWVQNRVKGKVAFTDDDMVHALDLFVQLVKKGYVSSDALSVPFATSQQRFLDSESAAMYPTGSWFAATADTAKKGDQFGVFGLPGSSDDIIIPIVTGGGASISSATKSPEAAKKFALWLDQDDEYLASTAKSDAQIPNKVGFTLDTSTLGPLFLSTIKLADDNKTVQSFGFAWGGASVPDPVSVALGVQVQNVLSGSATAEQVAKALDDAWDK